MAAAKKSVTKKTTAKKAPRKNKMVPVDAIVLKDPVLWAVVERKLLGSTVVAVFPTQDLANAAANTMDEKSGLSFNKYVVQRAELFNYEG